MVLALKDEYWWQELTTSIDSLNHNNPFSVPRLYQIWMEVLSEPVTTLVIAIIPIRKPTLSKLYISLSRMPYFSIVSYIILSHSQIILGSLHRARLESYLRKNLDSGSLCLMKLFT